MRGGGQWVLAAASGSESSKIDANPAASVVAVAIALAATLALVVMLRSRRLSPVEPAGSSIELSGEPPAVVDLLTGGFEVEDDAVPATVVHLAARRWFTIEDYGDDTIIRTRSTRPPGDTLQPYEQRVLDHIEHHVIDSVVPTRVLTVGPDGVSARWHKGFVREVVAHAQQLGLCVDRWTWAHRIGAWVLVAIALAPAWIVGDVSETTDRSAEWLTLGNVLLGVAFLISGAVGLLAWRTTRLHAQLDTPAGAAAAAHWLGVREFYRNSGQFTEKSAASVAIWDQHLAYATAMGLAPRVQRQIPFETEHDRHAWSRATGQWRRVQVRYRTLRPGWGRHPVKLAILGLFAGAVWGAIAYGAFWVADASWRSDVDDYYTITDQQQEWITLGAAVLGVFAFALACWFALRFLLGCVDAFRTRTVEGELVRRRSRGGGDDSTPTYHLAIDTSTATAPVDDTILAYRARSQIYHQTAQGSRVRIVVTPMFGYVKSVETLVAAPTLPTMADSPGAIDAVVAEAVGSFANGFSSLAGRWTATAGSTPEVRAQMTTMLADPKLAGTPAATFLKAFLGDAKPTG
jgi:hypothetical protein